jgi:hypothetical protein
VDAGGRTCSESEKRKPIGGVTGTFLRNSEKSGVLCQVARYKNRFELGYR